ncbi:glycosyltransferase family 2 protein [Succinivibrio dextrinosolvens]|uniref:glycosyltransferase family 2 protein n=1 Tax=Succinivibrio dextrinosolvens TaxID=83771 RepID=UPI0018CC1DC3|nr:glycosyltransferase [Succinivibrio dextrinosolvens]
MNKNNTLSNFYSENSSLNFFDFSKKIKKNLSKNSIQHVLVSVIMPVYNTPIELLLETIASVIRQDYISIEFIIIDDGSKKTLSEMLDLIEAKDDRIKVIHIPNSGSSKARNVGLDFCKGEFVFFIDSDDTIALNTISTLVNQSMNVDLVVCGCSIVNKVTVSELSVLSGSKIESSSHCIEDLCYMRMPFGHIETNSVWGKLYRKKIIDKIRFDEKIIMGEDFIFNFEYIINSKNIKYLDFKAYNYLVRSDSISRRFSLPMINTIGKMQDMTIKYSHLHYDALISRCVNIAFTILLMIPHKYEKEQKIIESFITLYRLRVFLNSKTKLKVRVATLSSYLGYNITKFLFNVFKKKGN